MGRVDKLYAQMDGLAEEYRGLLLKELEREDYSRYLYQCRDDDHDRRPYVIHGKDGRFDDANDLLSLEKQIRQLCEKLGEPLPAPVQVLEEYVESYLELKRANTIQVGMVKDFEGEHRSLRKRMSQKLGEGER